ncbi:MAG: 16S rRNA (cytosine(1402)-N(4))-methyltransferase [Betaproteobacteria bacterium RIFCSPLOWO2_12_FULL_63_13]|nr:MAG: 16S rRNA (cytosine(1402)-N(4))-methyltransferase [Betaproteobacteria bacterium RIFCSPLOWO2_02_FULL_63_19]OGA53476.1 MAG: 16S rRNA (cytosine(1402)-N(4))-methyltransferase [Betaproteobacteria bacterium RIFCSPLOWO2_12_FULL_63_13]
MSNDAHQPVLLHEAVDAMAIDGNGRARGVYVDATFGRGGHAKLILDRLDRQGRLIALDRDASAVAAGRLITDPRFSIVHARFSELEQTVRAKNVAAVDGVLLDLGVSSPQLDDPQRGFSFRFDAPLDMRMDQTRGATAAQWMARASEEEIREVVRSHGEERFAKQIAKAIVAARARGPVTGTRQLADLVGAAVRTREPGKDPATRTFQALRIFINQELEELSLVLPQALSLLGKRGRLVVISFHSLEDRIVKNFIRNHARAGEAPARVPLREAELPPPRLRILGKPQRPGEREIASNPRARSAVLRVAEKLV